MSAIVSADHVIAVANGAVALLSGVSSVAGVINPGLGLPKGAPITAGVDFYARAYAVRAVPLSAVALVMLAAGGSAGLAALLTVLGLAQVGDSVLGVMRRHLGMSVGAGVCALVHLVSAWWIASH
ncbi:hypothetical protein GCM10023194_38030 [Planotetraspora phitsanulokensis]|uniref:DUF4267 domain-containing protein n=1 Tax=Planotetraspora phitsanulokensis TaxID=575192 RepID=A0A8J3UF68_9ACTN|nr:hypothetical protein [Planotetraspora phitsanulokensis]GII41234.1 hypothetical protein Pph01_62370 [Planotetraspora phitsanulokensis]